MLRIVFGRDRAGSGADRESGQCDRRERQHHQRDSGRDGLADCPAMLSHIQGRDLILGHAVGRCGDLGDLVAEPTVVQIELRFRASPTHVDVPRLLSEATREAPRQRSRLCPVEIIAYGVPDKFAIRQQQQHPGDPVQGPPMFDFALTPLGVGGLGAGEHQEEPAAVHRSGDGRPESRVGRQRRAIPEHVQRTQAPPRLREPGQALLHPSRQQIVARVAVRDEHVVSHNASPPCGQRSSPRAR